MAATTVADAIQYITTTTRTILATTTATMATAKDTFRQTRVSTNPEGERDADGVAAAAPANREGREPGRERTTPDTV